MIVDYKIHEVSEYINWIYFFHAQRKIIELLTENNKLSASKLAGEIGANNQAET